MIEAILGNETASFEGDTWDGPSAEGNLARALIGRGVDPTTRIVFKRDGRAALLGSLSAFARVSYPGGDARAVRWAPHPRGSYAPALLAWHAALAEKAP